MYGDIIPNSNTNDSTVNLNKIVEQNISNDKDETFCTVYGQQ